MEFGNIAQLIIGRLQSNIDLSLFEDSTSNISRQKFINLVRHRCNNFSATFRPGDRILIFSGRGVDFFIDLVSVWAIGGVAIPISAESGSSYINNIILNSGVSFICANENIEGVNALFLDKKSTPVVELIDLYKGDTGDLCAILFTSGSTGTPKGVMLSHYVLANNSLSALKALGMNKERLYINIPFNFTSAICHFLACCFSDSTFIGIEKKLFMLDLVKDVESYNVAVFGGAPVQISWISEAIKSRKVGKLRLQKIISSGDRLSVDIIKDFLKFSLGTKIFTVYGLTELGGRFCVLPYKNIRDHIGSVGKPIEGLTVKIISTDNGEECKKNVEGEVVASGELITKGYYGNDKATNSALANKEFKTGDIGYIDDDGYLFLTDRLDDIFKVNGQKVSATLISDSIMKLKLFSDVSVISVHSDIFGTVPVAFCVMKSHKIFEKGPILRGLRKVLANNHIPNEFILCDSIPRTGSGKVRRSELHRLLSNRGLNE